jgi:hypothetical protein
MFRPTWSIRSRLWANRQIHSLVYSLSIILSITVMLINSVTLTFIAFTRSHSLSLLLIKPLSLASHIRSTSPLFVFMNSATLPLGVPLLTLTNTFDYAPHSLSCLFFFNNSVSHSLTQWVYAPLPRLPLLTHSCTVMLTRPHSLSFGMSLINAFLANLFH